MALFMLAQYFHQKQSKHLYSLASSLICMYVCMYIYMYIYMYVYIYIYIYTYMFNVCGKLLTQLKKKNNLWCA